MPFADSTALLADPNALRARFDHDGYVFFRGVVDRDVIAEVRAQITGICRGRGWFEPGTDPTEAITSVEPCVEGEERYFEVYDEIQRLESFHGLPHHRSVSSCMTALLGATAFPHPLSIARLAFPANDAWTTPPHQDFPNNQGTEELFASWIPLGDCPIPLGSLSVLRGSHHRGMAPLEFSLGAGNRRAQVDQRFEGLDWVGGDFECGDMLVFHSLTVHRALPNTTDRLRLSVDYRFQREGEPLTEGCLEPHFGRLSWDEIYAGWSRTDLQYYWRDKQYSIVPWDASLHAVPESIAEAVRMRMKWKEELARSGRSPAAAAELERFKKTLARNRRPS